MQKLGFLFGGIFGLIIIVAFISIIIMWFSVPVLMYAIYEKLKSIEKLLKK